MAAHDERLQRLITAIFTVHQDDTMDCETCSEQFDCLVELAMRGANLREMLPAVEQHLSCCHDCDEEFQALVSIIRAESGGAIAPPPDQRPTIS